MSPVRTFFSLFFPLVYVTCHGVTPSHPAPRLTPQISVNVFAQVPVAELLSPEAPNSALTDDRNQLAFRW